MFFLITHFSRVTDRVITDIWIYLLLALGLSYLYEVMVLFDITEYRVDLSLLVRIDLLGGGLEKVKSLTIFPYIIK